MPAGFLIAFGHFLLVEISSSCLYCVYCDQNKQCPPIDLKRFSVAHLTREHHKWRKAYYREQLDMCAEFNKWVLAFLDSMRIGVS